jgi:mannan endo-1,4-beta-mannosidase
MGKITRLTSFLSLLPLLFTNYATAQAVTYEAENGYLVGTTVDTAFAGYTGTGYVTGFDEGTDSVTITVTAASTALYNLNVTYQAPYGEKYTSLSLNGVASGQIYFPASTVFGTVSGGQLLLNAGQNNITFTNNWGWYLIDSITIAPSPAPAPHQVTGALNNPNASASVKKLMSYLLSQYGKHILSGQQGPASYA